MQRMKEFFVIILIAIRGSVSMSPVTGFNQLDTQPLPSSAQLSSNDLFAIKASLPKLPLPLSTSSIFIFYSFELYLWSLWFHWWAEMIWTDSAWRPRPTRPSPLEIERITIIQSANNQYSIEIHPPKPNIVAWLCKIVHNLFYVTTFLFLQVYLIRIFYFYALQSIILSNLLIYIPPFFPFLIHFYLF